MLYHLFAATMLLFTSCGHKTDRPALAGDTVLAENLQPKQQPAEAAPDVRLHDLHGQVKSLHLYYYETNPEWCFHITFSQQGEWLTTNGGTPIKEFFNKAIRRDGQGRLVELHHEAGETCEIEIDTYTYDAEGNLTQMVSLSEDAEEGENTTTTTYRILETDSHGNWTRREATDTEGGSYVSKRVIDYWD